MIQQTINQKMKPNNQKPQKTMKYQTTKDFLKCSWLRENVTTADRSVDAMRLSGGESMSAVWDWIFAAVDETIRLDMKR